jgi:hypothetical protein
MRDDLRTYIGFTYGPNKWQELLRIEADVRRQRQEHEYARREMIAKLTSAALIGLCALTIGGLLWLIIWLSTGGPKMKNLKSILGAIAPTLATAIGGPLGGMAMKMVADKLGLPDATLEAVDAAVASATPEQLAEIKKVEADFKVQMKALDVDLVKIAAADRDSARQRHAVMKDATPTVLAMGTLLAFFSYIGAVTFLAPDADLGLINVAVGWLGGSASAVISYYFGASAPTEGSSK